MGLLDDAIREHLELKRRRGADPGEVAREQQEALEPIGGVASTADGAAVEDHSAGEPVSGAPLVDDVQEPSAETSEALPSSTAADPVRASDPAAADPAASDPPGAPGVETAELDMSSVLDEGEAVDHGAAGEADTPEPAEGDSLEWEMPAETAAQAAAAEAAEADEDVLEETPEFLQDAPEHDRLWFEQRPPRDFDFGE